MSDLISRQALIDDLNGEDEKYSFDVQLSKAMPMEEIISTVLTAYRKAMFQCIADQPTGYNVESVVVKLEAIKKDRFAWCALHNMKTCEKYQAGCVDHLLYEIIKLVKEGGKNG